MMLRDWWRLFAAHRSCRPVDRRRSNYLHLHLEALEDRALPSISPANLLDGLAQAAGNQSVLSGDSGTTLGPFVSATHFSVSAPATVSAGQPFSITVTALDASGNMATSYTGTVHFTSTDPLATLPTNYIFVGGDAGAHTFTAVMLRTSGRQTITATDTVSSSITGTTGTVMVSPPAATHYLVAVTATAVAGTPLSVTVTALEALGNSATGYTGTVHLTSTDGQGSLPTNYSFTTSDAGVHVFTNGVTLKMAGSQTITVTDTANGSITSTSGTISVNPGPAAHCRVVGPALATAGSPFGLTVTAIDEFGNAASGYTGTVHFTSTDAQASLPANYTFTAADNGLHVFGGVLLKTAGKQTITAADTSLDSMNGSSDVMVAAAAANRLKIAVPSGVSPGVPFSVTLTALDPYGNVAAGYTGTVHFASSDRRGALPANYTFTPADAGVHIFANALSLRTAGARLTVADVGNSSIATTVPVVVNVPRWVASGADTGGPPLVRVYDVPTGALIREFYAYDPRFLGGVRVALADVNGDGIPDIITAPGPGGGPHIRVFDGRTGAVLEEFMAYSTDWIGGVFVAAGDVKGDGYADIVTGADAGGGPHVKVFSGRDNSLLDSFYAYSPAFRGGVRVAAGDIDGNGRADIVTAPGPGGGPDVRVFSGADGTLKRSFWAYSPFFTGGVYVAVGDVNGDGKADIITGAGSGGGPHVKVFSGAGDGALLASFHAYSPLFTGGVRVSVMINAQGRADIVTGAGPGGGPHVRVLEGLTLDPVASFYAFAVDFSGGVFVGGS